HRHHPSLHSFPTRRSSDLARGRPTLETTLLARIKHSSEPFSFLRWRGRDFRFHADYQPWPCSCRRPPRQGHSRRHSLSHGLRAADRKSTRLNSSHVKISYA